MEAATEHLITQLPIAICSYEKRQAEGGQRSGRLRSATSRQFQLAQGPQRNTTTPYKGMTLLQGELCGAQVRLLTHRVIVLLQ